MASTPAFALGPTLMDFYLKFHNIWIFCHIKFTTNNLIAFVLTEVPAAPRVKEKLLCCWGNLRQLIQTVRLMET